MEKIKYKIGKEERNKASSISTGGWTRNSHKCQQRKFGFNIEDFFLAVRIHKPQESLPKAVVVLEIFKCGLDERFKEVRQDFKEEVKQL